MEFEIASKKDDRFASDLAKFKTGKNFGLLSQHSNSQIRTESVKKLLNRAVVKHVSTPNDPKGEVKDRKLTAKFATKSVKTKAITPDENITAVTLLPRFLDDSPDVLLALLSPKLKFLQKIFSNRTLTKGLISVVRRDVAIKPTKMALQKMCSIAKNLDSTISTDLELKQQVRTL